MSDEDTVTLRDCPPGLFLFRGHLGFKSQYGNMQVFCADSGECFWGGTTDLRERGELEVQPVDAQALLAELEVARQRAREAEAVVARLPRTADGVPIVPGMELWVTTDDSGIQRDIVAQPTAEDFDAHAASNCYATRAAAESAAESAAAPAGPEMDSDDYVEGDRQQGSTST